MERARRGICYGGLTALTLLLSCGGGSDDDHTANGGAASISGGAPGSGGTASSNGGSTDGGGAGMGGSASGGAASGGAASGGAASGGAASGGAASGGSAGAATGGNAAAGTAGKAGNSGGTTASGGAAGATAGGGGTVAGGGSTAGSAAGGKAGTGGSATGGSGGASSGCADFKAPMQVGTIEATALAGPSGMVASRAHAGVLYANLDAGGPATIFAMTAAGKALGEYALTGAKATDWEDLSVGRGPGTGSYVYVGDFGDNASSRTEIQVLRVPEPEVSATQAPVQMAISDWQALRFTYPDGAHDAESLMVDPVTGDILIVTKISDGNSIVFRAPGTTPADTPTVLEKVCNVQIGASGRAAQASAGDISPSGDRVAIRSYTTVLVWPRAATLAATFAATPHTLAFSTEPQGEGLSFSGDGQSLYLAGEQARVIYQALPACP